MMDRTIAENRLHLIVLVGAVASGPVFGQVETGSAETVVVVGEATNSVVTTAEIEAYQANDLADIFRRTPSISVGGSVGIAQKIYIRGIEDALINVTVDGAPQTSTLFHHIGRVTIDPDLLRQVEVQAGAGEATSGPGAIGGAIRFRTKDASDLLEDGESFGGRLKVNQFSNDGRQYSGALYGQLNDDWGVLAYYNDIDRDNFEDGDGNEVLGTGADQQMAFVKFSGALDGGQRLSVSYESRDEEGEFGARPNWHIQPGDMLYPSAAERETVVANYAVYRGSELDLEVTLYNTESSFHGGRFDYISDISTFGFDVRNTSEFDIHRITYGIDFRDDEVESYPATSDPVFPDRASEEGSVLGLYVQNHSQLTDALLLSYGLRYDDYEYTQLIPVSEFDGVPVPDTPTELSNAEVSINAGLSYRLTDEWTIGLGYAEATRGKEIGDGFTNSEFLYDSVDTVVVDPGLKSEKVSNVEASLRYSAGRFDAKLAVFDAEIDDVIFGEFGSDAVYENIGSVTTSGFELDLAYGWGSVETFFGFASADTELDPRLGLYDDYPGTIDLNAYKFNGLGASRGDTINLGFDYAATSNVDFGMNVTHVDDLAILSLYEDRELGWVPELFALEKPSYTTVDAYAKWAATEKLALHIAVTNLLNEQYRDHSSVGDYSPNAGYGIVVGPWEAGRDIRLSATFSF